jgi:hypothetical protein
MQPRGVDQDQLTARRGDDPADRMPRRLRFARGDRDLDRRPGHWSAWTCPHWGVRPGRQIPRYRRSDPVMTPRSPSSATSTTTRSTRTARDPVAPTGHPLRGQAQTGRLRSSSRRSAPCQSSCRCSPPTVSTSSSSRSTSKSSAMSSTCMLAGTRSRPSPRSSAGVLAVVLVGDLADDLLEDVLDGHQPGGAAVFVDDDREVGLARAASRAAGRRPACSGTKGAGRINTVTGTVRSFRVAVIRRRRP